MKFETAADLYFIVSVFVPGFIYNSVLAIFVPRRGSSEKEALILRWFTGTALNYAVCAPIVYPLINGLVFAASPFRQGLSWLTIIFLAPIAVALVAARLSQIQAVRWIAGKVGLRSISPIPTGWDWIFGLQDPLYLLVTLKDGTKLAGFFGPASLASSDPDARDLYLEKAYTIPANGAWQEVPGNRGLYIVGSEIAFVEFKM